MPHLLGCQVPLQLAAENLFLRKQLAFYVERQVKPRRADDATRISFAALSSLIEWRRILTIVKPDTLIGWHRKGFRLFWRRKSKPRGRPRLGVHYRQPARSKQNDKRSQHAPSCRLIDLRINRAVCTDILHFPARVLVIQATRGGYERATPFRTRFCLCPGATERSVSPGQSPQDGWASGSR
jgi:hypothetical protein